MSIYTDNLKIMEVINEPDLWKFVEIEQIGPTRASVVCKTSAAAGVHFVRSEIQLRPTEECNVNLVLRCKFLGANFEEPCCGMDKMMIRMSLRKLLAKQEAAYYGETEEHWLEKNLDPEESEVH